MFKAETIPCEAVIVRFMYPNPLECAKPRVNPDVNLTLSDDVSV